MLALFWARLLPILLYCLPITAQIVTVTVTATITESASCSGGSTSPSPSDTIPTTSPASVPSSSQSGKTEKSNTGPSTSNDGSRGSQPATETNTPDVTTRDDNIRTITPSAVSTSSTSTLSGVTSNALVTTTDRDGHEIIVPFFWGCWFCGGGGIFGFGIGKDVLPKLTSHALSCAYVLRTLPTLKIFDRLLYVIRDSLKIF